MNKSNLGKDFESTIKKSLILVPDISIDRIPDQMSGYSGASNISDFIVFHSPDLLYLECKCTYGNTLNYKSAISKNQWIGMLEKSKIRNCVAGVCVWFIDYDKTVFVPIQELQKHKESGAKSLNINNILNKEIPFIDVDGVKLRVFFKYDGERFIKNIHTLSNNIWKEDNNE